MRKAGSRTTVTSPEVKSRLRAAQPSVFGGKDGRRVPTTPRGSPPPDPAERSCEGAGAGRPGLRQEAAGVRGAGLGVGSGQVQGWTPGHWGEAVARGRAPYLRRFPGSWGAGRPCRTLHPGRKGTTGLSPDRAGRASVLLPRRPPRRLRSRARGAFPQPRAPISRRGLGAPWIRPPGRRGRRGSERAQAPRPRPRARPPLPAP